MIFLDTSFLVALTFDNDENHFAASNSLKDILAKKYGGAYISDYVFDETVTLLLAKTRDISKVILIGDSIRSSFKMLRLGEEAFEKAWRLFKSQKGTRLSFTDCANVAIMEENCIKDIAAFDGDFKKIPTIRVV